MNLLQKTVDGIKPVDKSLTQKASAHLDNLTKPPGSLGRLEEIAVRYCLIKNTVTPTLGAKSIYTFAGDHGVAEEGVSAFPQEVTPQMVLNMSSGGAAINVLGRHAHADVHVVDVGVISSFDDAKGLIRKKVRPGTANMTKGPAMSVEEARQGIEVGIELAQKAHDGGVSMVGTGDMGIANTTPSSAIMAALLPCDVKDIVGRGTGIDDNALRNKVDVVKRALAANSDNLASPLDTLAAVGGLEIAGIAGLVLGAALNRMPVVVDGFISSAGALVACRLADAVKDYLFFSHRSAEAGHRTFFQMMETEPLLDLNMRLGEGTGAALAMHLIEAGVKIYNEMATFDSAGVSR
ncbi:MAG: nicotinate-nucleotide--dimethylbenzimidazole phosphoribosyltransferase [Deltaproteobacteria bacterium]|nr:nicotinate-nucleotide--dimethylbenzimidazole phosphoribosyltransferase [Deltaproteobacteria bacterium]